MMKSRLFWILILVSVVENAVADGGSVQLHSTAGSFIVTLFAEPPSVRAGQVDLSALVQDKATGQPILDANVTLRMTPVKIHQRGQPAWYPPSCAVDPPGDLARISLLHSGAANRLLYGALVEIPASGTWNVRANVVRSGEEASVDGNLEVSEPLPPAAAYWPFFLLPIAATGVYILRSNIERRERT